jgi:hypothetical protein
MTSKEFVIWLKGVVVGAPQYQATPTQWAAIREQVELVDDHTNKLGQLNPSTGIFGTPNNTSYTNLPSGSNITYTI